ncbi:exosortase N [Botryobacter ruber]|uniref:exosortase N n=1 Tax=Botryobacter ruber TaxID=2171629 RepID=UPI000E0A55D5|nr:exosortase N [Botryobacter ruber]
MMLLLCLQQQVTRLHVATAAITAVYLLLAFLFLQNYLLWDMPWLLALALLPFVVQAKGQQRNHIILLFTAAATIAFAAYTQATTVFFLAFVLALWCSLRSVWGGFSLYPALLLLLGSPIFSYMANILSFPLRLQLTRWAAGVLQQVQLPAEAAGNVILLNGEEFSVDPACAGLSMLAVSLLLAVFVLAHLQKNGGKLFPLRLVVLLLSCMLLLNLGCNLMRIVLLVFFRILPDNPLHDVKGLLCLLLYAVLPFYLLARYCYRHFGVEKQPEPQQPAKSIFTTQTAVLNLFLLLSLAGAGVAVSHKPAATSAAKAKDFPGFEKEELADGVLKLTSPQALVYVKPIRAFYATEHHPLICWEGSGYLFRQVRELQLGDRKIYMGELHQGKEKLYTAWWMDNGSHQTIDQLDWRWHMFRGEAAFEMVNVTVARQEQLVPEVERLLRLR